MNSKAKEYNFLVNPRTIYLNKHTNVSEMTKTKAHQGK